jgi:hypothetical protein
MDPNSTVDLQQANFILNAIQVGGLIGFMSVTIIAFVRGWVYAANVVEDCKLQVRELTNALKSANDGMERMAEAWESRNKLEADRRRDDVMYERLVRERKEGI